MKIKSIETKVHDTSFGGYPYKTVVIVEIETKEFNKKCPITSPARSTICGRQPARRDLGNLVLEVNNAVYALNSSIPAYNPSIDSKGGQRSKDGIKTMEFVYFFKDADTAEKLGLEVRRFKNGETMPVWGTHAVNFRGAV